MCGPNAAFAWVAATISGLGCASPAVSAGVAAAFSVEVEPGQKISAPTAATMTTIPMMAAGLIPREPLCFEPVAFFAMRPCPWQSSAQARASQFAAF